MVSASSASSPAICHGDWGVFSVSSGGPNDGTICVEETELPGAADRIVLPVSHTGILFSAEAARQTASFLATGRFNARASA